MAKPEFTPIPVFSAFLATFTVEEGTDFGDESDLVVVCTDCLDTVIVLTPDLNMRQVVAAVTEHRCDE
jgi:hypothetical protein